MFSAQTAVFGNSWYASDSTIHRHWLECGGARAQVAIRSTVTALQTSVSHLPQKVYLSAMQYIDFAASAMPTGNVFLPALHKSSKLSGEREVRLLMLQTGGEKAFSPGPSRGVDLSIDLGALIQGLRLAPRSAGWLHNLVKSLADRYSITYDDSNDLSEQQGCRFKSGRMRFVQPLFRAHRSVARR